MNPENDMLRHFILNQRRPRDPERKIYTPKYFSLMLTMMTLTFNIRSITIYQPFLEYIVLMIAIIIAFIITSFSQSIGHRRLYIISFIFYSGMLALITNKITPPLAYTLYKTSRLMLQSQIILQIYGTWPYKFSRIFVEMLLFYQTTQIIQHYGDYLYPDVISWILILMIFVNLIWLVCGQFTPIFMSINDFKSPVTDTVCKDFLRSILNKKIIIFTVLYFIVKLSLQIEDIFLVSYQIYLQEYRNFFTLFIIIILCYLANFNFKPSKVIFYIIILLVISLFILLGVSYLDINITFIILSLFYVLIYYGSWIFMVPQYWQILVNVGIRNLDFISSYSLLAHGLAQVLYQYPNILFYYDQEKRKFIINNQYITILPLIVIIIVLSFIFFQILGFKKYFSDTNVSSVQEDNFLIEIVQHQ